MLLSDSKNIMLGSVPVNKIYKGTNIVWERFSLEAYNLSTSLPVVKNSTIIVSSAEPSEPVTDFGTSWPRDGRVTRWYDFTDAYADSTSVAVYTGGILPPAIYVPAANTVYHGGVALPREFYIIIGNNRLLSSKRVTYYRVHGFAHYYYSTVTTSYTEFDYCLGSRKDIYNDGFDLYVRQSFYNYKGDIRTNLKVYVSGVEYDAGDFYSDGAQLVSLIRSLSR